MAAQRRGDGIERDSFVHCFVLESHGGGCATAGWIKARILFLLVQSGVVDALGKKHMRWYFCLYQLFFI